MTTDFFYRFFLLHPFSKLLSEGGYTHPDVQLSPRFTSKLIPPLVVGGVYIWNNALEHWDPLATVPLPSRSSANRIRTLLGYRKLPINCKLVKLGKYYAFIGEERYNRTYRKSNWGKIKFKLNCHLRFLISLNFIHYFFCSHYIYIHIYFFYKVFYFIYHDNRLNQNFILYHTNQDTLLDALNRPKTYFDKLHIMHRIDCLVVNIIANIMIKFNVAVPSKQGIQTSPLSTALKELFSEEVGISSDDWRKYQSDYDRPNTVPVWWTLMSKKGILPALEASTGNSKLGKNI